MKVSHIKVKRYKAIREMELDIATTGTICVTGTNGSGKTSLLEMISSAIARLGFAAGGEQISLSEDGQAYEFSVTFDFSDDVIDDELPELSAWLSKLKTSIHRWDKTLTITLKDKFYDGSSHPDIQISAIKGSNEHVGSQIATWLRDKFDNENQLKHLNIDANRAYLTDVNRQWQLYEIRDLENIQGKKSAALLRSTDLYHQWMKYIVDQNTRTLAVAREKARREFPMGGDDVPPLVDYSDPLDSLSGMIGRILPHLQLIGTGIGDEDLYVESFDERIRFQDLSGGEREVLFLVGQFDRLRVTNGILLIDEPELHLNPNLTRKLVSVLQDSATGGQVWIATHSFEAVEAAGASNTVLLARNDDGTTEATWLNESPALVHLAAALGRTGFSPAGTTYVLVEGGGATLRERARYEELLSNCGQLEFLRAGGSKKEVLSSLDDMLALAESAKGNLDFKGVIDSDYDSLEETSFEIPDEAYLLGVHEIENLFLEPESILLATAHILKRGENFDPTQAIRDSFDRRMGSWIWGRTEYHQNRAWRKSRIDREVNRLKPYFWGKTASQVLEHCSEAESAAMTIEESVWPAFSASIQLAQDLRDSAELWRHCNGKETLEDIARLFDFADKGQRLEMLLTAGWNDGSITRPDVLTSLREFFACKP